VELLMPNAARVTDKVEQESPHCHAAHPPAGNPIPHPPTPLMIVKGMPTVKINSLMAARVTDQTEPCTPKNNGCIAPGGPGMISKGSATVKIGGLPAARAGDMTAHTGCVAPVPGPTGTILPPCSPTVMIGG
jgi:uncharacterized Zn-binding protein involved in type VI secretion